MPWLFLVYALPLVIALSIIMPPFQVADELAHTERADQISRGKLLSDILGGTVDANWQMIGRSYQGMWFHPEVKQTYALAHEAGAIRWSGPQDHVNFQNTAQYGPFLYVPQAIGLSFGRMAGITLVHSLMAARLLNGFAACVFGFLALSICRRGRALMFATLLLPMTLSEFSSASQDALLISLSLLAIAMASRMLAEQRLASINEFAVFAAIVVATTFARPSQFALALLTPAFVGWRDPKWRTKGLIGVVVVLTVIAGMLHLAKVAPPLGVGLSPARQVHSLLAHPLLLPSAMRNYFATNVVWFPETVVGYLGWTDTLLPTWYYLTAAAVLLMALIAPRNTGRALWPGALALIAFAALLTLLSAALFMSWTPVGKVTIDGMQGRYILPVLPLLAWTIPEFSWRTESLLMPIWYPILLFPLLTLVVTPAAIVARYYGSWGILVESLKVFLRP